MEELEGWERYLQSDALKALEYPDSVLMVEFMQSFLSIKLWIIYICICA
jgi:hypothetical protein